MGLVPNARKQARVIQKKKKKEEEGEGEEVMVVKF